MSLPYDALPIVRSLLEIREIDPKTGVKGDLQAIYCTGKRDRELFFRFMWIEYSDELAKYNCSFSVSDVVYEIHQKETFTILRLKCS